MPPHVKGNSIQAALYYFCGMPTTSDASLALYALRNSLMHDASLTSVLKRKNQSDLYFYFFYASDFEGVVKPAHIPWNGDNGQITTANVTYINLAGLRNLADIGVSNLRRLFREQPESLNILRSASEIRTNYLRWTRKTDLVERRFVES
jgi:hypothetical protein